MSENEPNDREKLLALARLVRRMREKQREYFRNRNNTTLNECRDLERHCDDALKAILEPKSPGLWEKM